MTMAVCFKCGEIKFGAFCPCGKCGEEPQSEDDLIISYAMTDHFFDKAMLEKISEATKNGRPPDLTPEDREGIREVLQECGPMLGILKKTWDDEKNRPPRRRSWWKFW